MFLFCLVFAMSLCASVYVCFVVTCWERADLLALVCSVYCEFVTFPLVSWVRFGTWLYRWLIFATLLSMTISLNNILYRWRLVAILDLVIWDYSWTCGISHLYKSSACMRGPVWNIPCDIHYKWAVSCDFQKFGMCDQQRLRPACAYAQSDQSLC